MSSETAPPNVNDVRAALLGGTTDINTLAAALDCSIRKIERMIPQGLPVIRIGRDRRFNLERCREWLMSHERFVRAPRGPGRPAGRRAA
jgi:hypothetical protein